MPIETESSASKVDLDRELPSGRSVVLRVSEDAEEIEIRSPSGEMEVRIVLTESGPVVSLKSARLELQAAEEIALRTKKVTLDASQEAVIQSAGSIKLSGQEVRIKTEEDIHLNGAYVRLNCPEVPTSKAAD